jgi:hypothetical protein
VFVRRWFLLALSCVVLALPSWARGEVTTPAPLGPMEWTAGIGVLKEHPIRPSVVAPVGVAFPVARLGTDFLLYFRAEVGVPIWVSQSLSLPFLAKFYLRYGLTERVGLRLGVAAGVDLALNDVKERLSSLLLSSLAVDVRLSKRFGVLLEPQFGLGHDGRLGTYSTWFPRVSCGFYF